MLVRPILFGAQLEHFAYALWKYPPDNYSQKWALWY